MNHKCLVILLVALLAACASTGDTFDDTFDPEWMRVTTVEPHAMPYICQRPDKLSLDGCAKRWNDAGYSGTGAAGRGTCAIYISRVWPEGSAGYNWVLAHEARHCRGWRHVGD